MENLEKQIVTRLNNYLEKYGFCIKSTDTDAHLFGSHYDDMFSWGLFKKYSNAFAMCYRIVYLWKTSNDMLLSKKHNIFNAKYSQYNFNAKYSQYNEVCDIRCYAGDSLEEIIINMDLIGI